MSATAFEERLAPGLGVLAALSLSFPMVALALAPFGWVFAIVSGIAGWVLTITLAVVSSPTIRVTDTALRAGSIDIPRAVLGNVVILTGEKARVARGPGLSPLAAHLIRGDIGDLVQIEITDPRDPTPYLLISSRRAEELAKSLTS